MHLGSRWVWFAVATLGCGGRSDVEANTPGRLAPDAGVPPLDAGAAREAAAEADAVCTETCDGTCEPGGCLVQLAAGPQPCPGCENASASLVVDATTVYWTAEGDDIYAVLAKGGPTQIFAANAEAPLPHPGGTLAVDSDSVYWTTLVPPGPEGRDTDAVLIKYPIAGGAPTTLASAPATDDPGSIALGPTTVYWLADSGFAHGVELLGVPKAGGAPLTLASQLDAISDPTTIAVDATHVYWATTTAVLSVPIGGGTLTTLASYVATFVMSDLDLFWIGAADSAGTAYVMTVPKTGGEPRRINSAKLDASSQLPWGGLALRGSNLYVATFNFIEKIPLEGGPLTTLTSGDLGFLTGLALDDTSVYFTSVYLYPPVMKLTPTCACP